MTEGRGVEIAWLLLLAVLVAAGGYPVLTMLIAHRAIGLLVLLLAFIAAVIAIRRAYVGSAERVEVTKAAAYCCAIVLAAISVLTRGHYGMPIVMAEVAILFDVISVVARARAAAGPAAGRE